MPRKIALGFRVHSGWTMMVAVAGSPDRPVILDRRRIQLADTPQSGALSTQMVQPYHAARDMGVIRGAAFLDKCREESNALVRSSLEAAIKQIGGDRVQCCGVLTGSGRRLATLEATLASHPAIHTAEGAFFREIIVDAAGACGLRVRQIKEKELFDLAASEFKSSVADLSRGLNELGKTMGPPWQQDHKFAALAGWLAL
jgi:hypothetical protein